MKKPTKKQFERAQQVAAAITMTMQMEDVPVQGAAIMVITAFWLLQVDKRDRLAALQHLHMSAVNMGGDLEKKIEAGAKKEKK